MFEESCGGIRVTMYRPNTVINTGGGNDFKEKTKEKIMLLMESNPSITYDDLMKELDLSKSGIEYAVRVLKKSGLIERIGPDKGGTWKVNR